MHHAIKKRWPDAHERGLKREYLIRKWWQHEVYPGANRGYMARILGITPLLEHAVSHLTDRKPDRVRFGEVAMIFWRASPSFTPVAQFVNFVIQAGLGMDGSSGGAGQGHEQALLSDEQRAMLTVWEGETQFIMPPCALGIYINHTRLTADAG